MRSFAPWLGLLLLFCGCAAEPPRNLVLISLDTLRPDFLGAYGYERPTSPTLDALAREGVVFEVAVSPAPWTLPAHASLLTGLYPSRHGTKGEDQGLAPGVGTLAQWLAEAGFETAAFVNSHYLSDRYGLERGFATFRYAREFGTAPGPSPIGDWAVSWLGAEPSDPFFLFLHFYDTHRDYEPLPRFERLFARPYEGSITGSRREIVRFRKGRLEVDEADARRLADLYAAEIRQLDETLDRVFSTLEQGPAGGRTLVVVTSDHGEEFLEHGALGHGRTHYDEVLRVPLLLRGPGLPRGRRVTEPVSLVDLAPTLLAQLGVPAPAGLDGVDLSPLWRARAPEALADRALFAEADRRDGRRDLLRSVRRGRFKLILERESGRASLYDLEADPGETSDRSDDEPGLAARLRRDLEGFGVAEPVHAPRTLPGLTDETRRQLEALGYAQDPVPEASR